MLSFLLNKFSTFAVLILMLHHDLAEKNVIILMMDIFSNKLKLFSSSPQSLSLCLHLISIKIMVLQPTKDQREKPLTGHAYIYREPYGAPL